MQDKNDIDLYEKKRLKQRRSTNIEVAEEKRNSSRRICKISTDEKRVSDRRNEDIPVAEDKRKSDRRIKQEPVEKRVRHRRNSSLEDATDNPTERFKSGVEQDSNKRSADRRADKNKIPDHELDNITISEADILKAGNRKRERRNANLRGEPPNSPIQRFKSGVPVDTDKRSSDRRSIPVPEEDYDSPEALEAYKKLEKRKVDRRICAKPVDFSQFPNKEDRRRGDRREKNLLNRRDCSVASGIRPELNRRARIDQEPIPAERRDSTIASGFRPDLNRRKNTPRFREKIDGVTTGTEEDLEKLRDTAPDDALFITGKTSIDDNSLDNFQQKEMPEKKPEVKQNIRTGLEVLPLKK